jgi:tellurite resistance protein TerC
MAEEPDPLLEPKASIAAQLVRGARKLVVLVVGGTVLAIGVVMIVAPGPALVVIPAGLAILATEFIWARRLLTRVRDYARTTLGTNGKVKPKD